jgi:hypothetical protein
MTTPTATVTPVDKAALRGELEATHAAYRELVGQLPDAKWNAKSSNAAFTCGQLAWHIASGLGFSAEIVENARKGKSTNIPSFLMPLAYKINERRIRSRSKAATKDSVLADYERDSARLLRLLDEVPSEEFSRSFTNYAQTRTVEEMFRVPVEHFAEHAPEIRAAL